MKEDPGACFQAGWEDGPSVTGGDPGNYVCELPGDHEGDHMWGGGYIDITAWPVAECPHGFDAAACWECTPMTADEAGVGEESE
jgi:hypothetical protein